MFSFSWIYYLYALFSSLREQWGDKYNGISLIYWSWYRLCRYNQIGSIHLSHCYHIFPWLCAWGVCYIIFVTYCIYVPGKPRICFHYHCAVYDKCKYPDTFWLADRTRLFVQYTISLSSLCISLVMIERIYILCLIIIIKSKVWNITHCLG